MRRQLILGGATAALLAACATAPAQPAIGQPGYCGQTADGKAVVALHQDATTCAVPGKKLILTAEFCGPTMQGSNVADDCYRGNAPDLPSPDVYRLGTLQAHGGYNMVFVASDGTSA